MTAIDKPAAAQPVFPPQKKTLATSILYADDDASLRDLVPRVLVNAGYHVDTAPDGQAAWVALHARTYDLLITDQRMPYLTGAELIRKVRLARMTLPVILVPGTLDALPLDELPWIECGTTLAKPFSHGELVSVVRDVLRAAVSVPTPSGIQIPVLKKISMRVEPYRCWGINE